MARERIRTTREDATGFEEGVAGVRKPTILKPFNKDALEAFNKRKKASPATSEPHPKVSGSLETAAPDASESLQLPANNTPVQQESVQQEPLMSATETAPKEALASTAPVLATIVLPPRAKQNRGVKVDVRLRLLVRQVEPMRKIVERGIDPGDVLRAAYSRLPEIRIEPRYIPQVQEPSGPSEWNYRTSVAVKKEILQAIQDQVLNGAEAPRSSLIVGQIERAWFACVDDTIKELSK